MPHSLEATEEWYLGLGQTSFLIPTCFINCKMEFGDSQHRFLHPRPIDGNSCVGQGWKKSCLSLLLSNNVTFEKAEEFMQICLGLCENPAANSCGHALIAMASHLTPIASVTQVWSIKKNFDQILRFVEKRSQLIHCIEFEILLCIRIPLCSCIHMAKVIAVLCRDTPVTLWTQYSYIWKVSRKTSLYNGHLLSKKLKRSHSSLCKERGRSTQVNGIAFKVEMFRKKIKRGWKGGECQFQVLCPCQVVEGFQADQWLQRWSSTVLSQSSPSTRSSAEQKGLKEKSTLWHWLSADTTLFVGFCCVQCDCLTVSFRPQTNRTKQPQQ